MRRIEPYKLWIGHAGDGHAFREMSDHGIRAVVQLAIEEPPVALPRELVLLRFPLLDGGGNDAAWLRLAVTSVAGLIRTGTPTLVCCGAGMSRSPAVVASALSLVECCDPARRLQQVTATGPADVSPSFWTELQSALRAG